MDKQTLTLSQLKELKHFINSRGFREPEIQMEILDHFACKVEEKMAAKPALSLEDAMHEAHREFGYSGFHKIRASLDAYTKARYKKIYWAQIKQLVLSIPYLSIVLLGAYGLFSAFVSIGASKITDPLGQNPVGSASCVIMLALLVAKAVWIRRKRNYYHIQQAFSVSYVSIALAYIVFPGSTAASGRGMIAEGIVISVLMALFITDYIASYKTLRAAEQDHDEFEALYKQQSLTS